MNRRVKLFEDFNQHLAFEQIFESVTGEIKDVQKDVDEIMKDLKDEGKDAETDEVKAAILLQAIENDGEIEEVDVEKAKEEVTEGMKLRGQTLNESASGIIHLIEVSGNILGNSALLEFISKKLEKMTGKKMEEGKLKSTIEKILGGIKKVTGLPGKAIAKFFEWVAGKLGADINGKKAAQLLGAGALVIFLFTLGVIHFPVLGSGVLWWVLSLTGLVGKSVELLHIYHEIRDLIKEVAEKKDKEAAEELGVKPEELEKLATA